MIDLCHAALRAGQIPDAAGITTTLLLIADEDDWLAGTGVTVTGHDVRVATEHARRWVSGDARRHRVTLTRTGAIGRVGSSRRLFTENQRLALIARDRGCCFPGCDAPPQYTEAHHVIDYAKGGPTTVENGALLCGFHHDNVDKLGWQCEIRDGHPWWTPPAFVDPDRRPLRNLAHHPELVLV